MARESALHRSARVKLQLRDKHGRWIEMGGGVKWFSSKLGKEVSGTVVGTKGQNALVDMNDEKGHPSKGTPVSVPAHTIEVVDSKATLDLPAAPSASTPPTPPNTGNVATPSADNDFPHEGAKLTDVSAQDMAAMPKGTILTSTMHNGHFIKGDGDVWQQKLSSGGNGALGTSASVKNHDGFSDWVFAKPGTNPNDIKATTNAPEAPSAPVYSVTHTSDGHTYISVPEGAELYTPARSLVVGDELIAPDGAHPQKPFSIGRSWATKDAERVNTQGPKIGKVISIKENAYAVVQLPEGETVESTQHPGEMVNTVTVGLSNRVIKATPELKASLKDVIPEPTYSDPNAPSTPDANAPSAPDANTPAAPDANAPAENAPDVHAQDVAPAPHENAPEAAPPAENMPQEPAPAENAPAAPEATPAAPEAPVAAPEDTQTPKAEATPASDIEKGLAELEQSAEDVSSANLQGDDAAEVLDGSSFKFTGNDGSQYTVSAAKDENGDWNFVVSDQNGAEVSSHIIGSEDNHALSERMASGSEVSKSDNTPVTDTSAPNAPAAPESYNENGLTVDEQRQVDGAMRLATRSYDQFKDEEGDRYKAIADNLLAQGAERNKASSSNDSSTPTAPETTPVAGPSNEEKIANAEKMYGTGSPQHKQAQERFGKSSSNDTAPSQQAEKAPESAPQAEKAPEPTPTAEKPQEATPAPSLIEPDKAPEKPLLNGEEGYQQIDGTGLKNAENRDNKESKTPATSETPAKFGVTIERQSNGLEQAVASHPEVMTPDETAEFNRLNNDLAWAQHDNRRGLESTTRGKLADLQRRIETRLDQGAMSRYRNDTPDASVEKSGPNVPPVNEDGLLPNEAQRLSDLETRLGNAYNPNNPSAENVDPLEREINELLAHGEARKNGENVGDFKASDPVPDQTPSSSDNSNSSESKPSSEPAQDHTSENKATSEGTPAQAPDTAPQNAPETSPQAPAVPAAQRTRSANSSGSPVAGANGAMISRGDSIGHPTLGPVQITNTIPSSGRIEFTDPATGRTRSVRAANVSRIDPNASPASETHTDTPSVKTPGERFVDSATGKKGFGDKNGARVLVGDKVVDRNGNVGEVVSVYGGADGLASVPVKFEDGTTRRVKGSQLSKHDGSAAPAAESTPAAEKTPEAPREPFEVVRPSAQRRPSPEPSQTEAPASPEAPATPARTIPEDTPERRAQRLSRMETLPTGAIISSTNGEHSFTKTGPDQWSSVSDPGHVLNNEDVLDLLKRGNDRGLIYNINRSGAPAEPTPSSAPVAEVQGTNITELPVTDRLREFRQAPIGSTLTSTGGKVFTKTADRVWTDHNGNTFSPADMSYIVGQADVSGPFGLTHPETASVPDLAPGTVLPSDVVERRDLLTSRPIGDTVVHTASGNTLTKISADKWKNEADGLEFTNQYLAMLASNGEWKLNPKPESSSRPTPSNVSRPIPQDIGSRQRVSEEAPIGTVVTSSIGLSYTKISDSQWADTATGNFKYHLSEFASMLKNNQYSGDWSVTGFDVPDITPETPSLLSMDQDTRTEYVASLPNGSLISHELGREFRKAGPDLWIDNNGTEWENDEISRIVRREGWSVTPPPEAPAAPEVPADVIHDKLPVGTFLPNSEGSKSGMKRVGPDSWEMVKDGQPTGRFATDDTVKMFQELMGTSPAVPVDNRLGNDVGMSANDLQLPGGQSLGQYVESGGSFGALSQAQKQAVRTGYARFIDNLNTQLPEGFRAELHGNIHFGGDSMTTFVQFYKGDRALGAAERRFSSSTDSRTGKRMSSVEHAFWAIPNDVQGAGLSAAFLKASKQMYRQMGLDRITVHADISVGSYAWARGGFDFRSPSYMSSAIAAWEYNFPSAPRGRQSEWAAAKQKFAELKARATRENFMNGTHPAAVEFANIGRPEGNAGANVTWFGKELLMNTHWYGDFMLNSDVPSATVAPSP